MHGMAPHMHMACTEEQEDGDGEVAEGEPHHVLGTWVHHKFPDSECKL